MSVNIDSEEKTLQELAEEYAQRMYDELENNHPEVFQTFHAEKYLPMDMTDVGISVEKANTARDALQEIKKDFDADHSEFIARLESNQYLLAQFNEVWEQKLARLFQNTPKKRV